jgi:hypothetical protein
MTSLKCEYEGLVKDGQLGSKCPRFFGKMLSDTYFRSRQRKKMTKLDFRKNILAAILETWTI